jgi:hypothetical protein
MTISDDDYTRAGLLPPGFVLRAKTREAKREYAAWADECVCYLDDGVAIPQDDLVEWVDWQIAIFFREATDAGQLWGDPVWWSVRKEASRREHLAAYGATHDYVSGGHPYPGKVFHGETLRK